MQDWIRAHVRPENAVKHAIKRVDLQGERLEMPRQKGGADAILSWTRRLLPLHIMQEDGANKVERQLRKSEAALLLESRIGQRFDGVVTGASADGVWVRIFTPPSEGKLVTTSAGFKVGDKVRVKLVSTNVERGFIDFVLGD